MIVPQLMLKASEKCNDLLEPSDMIMAGLRTGRCSLNRTHVDAKRQGQKCCLGSINVMMVELVELVALVALVAQKPKCDNEALLSTPYVFLS